MLIFVAYYVIGAMFVAFMWALVTALTAQRQRFVEAVIAFFSILLFSLPIGMVIFAFYWAVTVLTLIGA